MTLLLMKEKYESVKGKLSKEHTSFCMNIKQIHGVLHVKLKNAEVIALPTDIILPTFSVKILGKCVLVFLMV